ncbi:hypothetical protein ABZV67_17510 [Streptomyces sp. NPDC005065]
MRGWNLGADAAAAAPPDDDEHPAVLVGGPRVPATLDTVSNCPGSPRPT